MKREKQQAAKVTVSGTIIKVPQRVKMATGKVMTTILTLCQERMSHVSATVSLCGVVHITGI